MTSVPPPGPICSATPGPLTDVAGLHAFERSRREARRTIALSVGLSGVAVVAVWVAGFVVYANHDRFELLDLPEVAETAEEACLAVTGALSESENSSRRDRIAAGNVAIDKLVATMQALGPRVLARDRPSGDWVGDWQDLAAARQRLATALPAHPDATFVMPQTPDGYPITGRMIYASGADCEEAITLASTP